MPLLPMEDPTPVELTPYLNYIHITWVILYFTSSLNLIFSKTIFTFVVYVVALSGKIFVTNFGTPCTYPILQIIRIWIFRKWCWKRNIILSQYFYKNLIRLLEGKIIKRVGENNKLLQCRIKTFKLKNTKYMYL